MEVLRGELDLQPTDRKVVGPALVNEEKCGEAACALELEDGTVVTGKNTKLMTAPASCILNAVKTLANVPDRFKLLAPNVLEPITKLKQRTLGDKNFRLNLEEVLIALSICAATNDIVRDTVEKLEELKWAELHSSRMLHPTDENILRKLKINVTSEPRFTSQNLYDN